MAERSYSEQEVREILRRAVERDSEQGLRRDNLVAAAAEMGIDAGVVDDAIEGFEEEQAVEQELAALNRRRRQSLLASLGTWFTVNAGLLGIDLVDGKLDFFFYPLIVWAVALLLANRRVIFKQPEKDRLSVRRRIDKQRARDARKRAVERRRAAGWKLEDAIEQGVDTLLSGAAEHLAESLSKKAKPAYRAPSAAAGDEGEVEAEPAVSASRSRARS